jgi:1-aminocyclopropane-1-carboxylate deaminase/D-cysteine desulfhydrase-like pyridoxal-dependent ACC family enzyme
VRLLVLDEGDIDIPSYPHLMLSKKLGAELIFVPIEQAQKRISAEKVRFSGYRWIPGGGHCSGGLEAYKAWFLSVLSEYPELRNRNKVVLPFGTGTTALGILAAISKEGLSMRVIGVSVSRDRTRCLTAAREFIGEGSITNLEIEDRYSGRYGERETHHDGLRMQFFKKTGILPDPIYNVRVIEYLYEENVTEGILIHTGGQLNNLLS